MGNEIKDLRSEIKKIGFNVNTKSMSWGSHVVYIHIESGQELTFNVFTPDTLIRWAPLFEWLKGNSSLIDSIKKEAKDRGRPIYGLNPEAVK